MRIFPGAQVFRLENGEVFNNLPVIFNASTKRFEHVFMSGETPVDRLPIFLPRPLRQLCVAEGALFLPAVRFGERHGNKQIGGGDFAVPGSVALLVAALTPSRLGNTTVQLENTGQPIECLFSRTTGGLTFYVGIMPLGQTVEIVGAEVSYITYQGEDLDIEVGGQWAKKPAPVPTFKGGRSRFAD